MSSDPLTSQPRPSQTRKRFTIGFSVPWGTDNNYVVPIWQGVVDAAQEHDVNLISFAGKQFWVENQQGYLPDVLPQMNPTTVDGVIMVSAPLEKTVLPLSR